VPPVNRGKEYGNLSERIEYILNRNYMHGRSSTVREMAEECIGLAPCECVRAWHKKHQLIAAVHVQVAYIPE